jgi:glycosyltransferase involved in cell wall biosynthesis
MRRKAAICCSGLSQPYAISTLALPSHQENFGIAVAEALGSKLPVLISDKVNIWREVQEDGAGIVASDTVEGTIDALSTWLRMDPQAAAAMREQALATFMQRFHVEAMSKDLARVLRETANKRDGGLTRGMLSASFERY